MTAQRASGTTTPPYVGAMTRILLSFAMDNHGAAFAYRLRDKLMKRLNYFSPNAVYMGGVALSFPPDGPGPVTNGMPPNGFAGIQQIPATKVYGLGGLLWHKEDYGIGEDALSRVVEALGP